MSDLVETRLQDLPTDMLLARMRPKHVLFCHEYMLDFDARKAAERAGYSVNSSYRTAWEILAREDVSLYLARLQQQRFTERVIDMDTIMQALSTIATYDIGNMIGRDGNPLAVHDLPEELRRALQSIKFQKQYVTIETRTFNGDGDETVEVRETVTTQVVEIKMPDRLKAHELLGRHYGMFNDDGGHAQETARLIIDGLEVGDETRRDVVARATGANYSRPVTASDAGDKAG